MLDGELTGEDDALGLVTDVEEDLIVVDLDDRALDDVAIIEVLDRLVDGGQQVLFGPDVVHCNLRSAGARLLGGGGHVVVFSETDEIVGGQNRWTPLTVPEGRVGPRTLPTA